MTANDFRMELAAGRSRSGKTFLTAQRVAKEKNLLVWDTMGEFAKKFRCKRITTAAQIKAIATRGMRGRYAFDVTVTRDNFDLFCRCAWLWIRVMAHRGERVALVVEELADVTPPGKAPAAWGDIVRKSMRFNPHIYALTQRPAESDKTIVGNCTVIRCHSMKRAMDRKSMAQDMDLPQSKIDALDMSKFQYIECDDRTGIYTLGGKGMRPTRITV